MFHIPAVDEEELMDTFLARRLRFAHKTMNLTQRSIHIDGQKSLVYLLSEHIDNALAQSAGLETCLLYTSDAADEL